MTENDSTGRSLGSRLAVRGIGTTFRRVGTTAVGAAASGASADDEQTIPAVENGEQSQGAPSSWAFETPEDADSTEDAPDLELDQIFEVLKNARRREVLRYLAENGGEATLGTLAEHIAAKENQTTVAQITSSQRKRVYVGLYQCHLPKMDDMGIIDFEKNRGTIEIGPNVGRLEPYLAATGERSTWPRTAVRIAAGGVLLAVAIALATGWMAATALVSLLTVVALGIGSFQAAGG